VKNFLKIAIIATTHETISSFMLSHIKKLSINYEVFICCKNASLLKKLVPKNVLLFNVNFERKPNFFIDIIVLTKLSLFFLCNKIDYSFSITPKAGFITALSAFILRVPYRVHWFTGQIWITKKGLSVIFYKFLDKVIFFLSHHVLVDSPSQRRFLIANKIILNTKSTVLHKGSVGGVDIKKFKFNFKNRNKLRKELSIPKSSFVFLYLGRIHQDKGVIELINAFKKIENFYNIFLIFVGPIECHDFKKLIKNNNQIKYCGSTNQPQKWYSIANLLCLPSYREGFGTAIIEAGSCSLPTLASDIYGIEDAIIKDQTGFFHKVGNVNDIKKKMLYAINNRNLLKTYGKKARKRVVINFNANLLAKKFLDFINKKKLIKSK
jgi:glycosyltransferase involved in cell wall biosynthesis